MGAEERGGLEEVIVKRAELTGDANVALASRVWWPVRRHGSCGGRERQVRFGDDAGGLKIRKGRVMVGVFLTHFFNYRRRRASLDSPPPPPSSSLLFLLPPPPPFPVHSNRARRTDPASPIVMQAVRTIRRKGFPLIDCLFQQLSRCRSSIVSPSLVWECLSCISLAIPAP